MAQPPRVNTSSLRSLSGTFGEIDIVSSDRAVTLSVSGRNYDVMGKLHVGAALANLSISDAQRLSRLLHEAVASAENANSHQPGLWSDATVSAVAQRVRA